MSKVKDTDKLNACIKFSRYYPEVMIPWTHGISSFIPDVVRAENKEFYYKKLIAGEKSDNSIPKITHYIWLVNENKPYAIPYKELIGDSASLKSHLKHIDEA